MINDETRAIVLLAIHHAVRDCKLATGQHRTIDTFVNQNQLADEVIGAWMVVSGLRPHQEISGTTKKNK